MKPKILILEDDPDIRYLVNSVLSDDYEVVALEYGRVFKEVIYAEKPDLIILDIYLPDTLGWDILDSIRREPSLASIPVVILTSRTDISDKLYALQRGADAFISKPVDPARLRHVISTILGGG